MKRATINDAPGFLNTNDRAMWVLGFNTGLEAVESQPRGTDAQILKERELTASAITGAIAFGAQGINPPPSEDHWLASFWRMGRDMVSPPEPCLPARHCERHSRGLGACVAGHCNPPAPASRPDGVKEGPRG